MKHQWRKRIRYVIGIDEVGRGPLAGPVVVAGVGIRMPNAKCKMTNKYKNYLSFSIYHSALKNIRDSKRLSARQREEWYAKITAHPGLRWAVAHISPSVIDRINISRAADLGAKRVYMRLASGRDAHAMLDGGLFLPPRFSQETIIKGDEKVPLISAASIVAKVRRDRIMRRLHKKYPQYGFDTHKGYPTKVHREMVRSHGRSPVHRKTFLKKLGQD